MKQKKKKKQKAGFFSMLLGKLSAILLGNLLIGKGTIRTGEATTRVRPDF